MPLHHSLLRFTHGVQLLHGFCLGSGGGSVVACGSEQALHIASLALRKSQQPGAVGSGEQRESERRQKDVRDGENKVVVQCRSIQQFRNDPSDKLLREDKFLVRDYLAWRVCCC